MLTQRARGTSLWGRIWKTNWIRAYTISFEKAGARTSKLLMCQWLSKTWRISKWPRIRLRCMTNQQRKTKFRKKSIILNLKSISSKKSRLNSQRWSKSWQMMRMTPARCKIKRRTCRRRRPKRLKWLRSWRRSTSCKQNSRRRTKNLLILTSETVLSSSGFCSQGVLHFKRKNSSSLRTSTPYEHRDVFPKQTSLLMQLLS